MSKVFIGCDPEFLCADASGIHKSVIGLIPGTKENPSPINEGTIQVDGVAVELGIDPADSMILFDNRIQTVLNQAAEMVARYGLSLTSKASAEFPSQELEHPDAQRFGCDPDFSAWDDGAMNDSPIPIGGMRVAGGHIHIGCDDIDQIQLVKALDLCVAIPSMHLEDPVRKVMYGKAGAFRPKPYGVEYRTCSNFWTFTSERRRWVYEQVMRAVSIHREMKFSEQIREVIDYFDLDEARRISSEHGLVLCQ